MCVIGFSVFVVVDVVVGFVVVVVVVVVVVGVDIVDVDDGDVVAAVRNSIGTFAGVYTQIRPWRRWVWCQYNYGEGRRTMLQPVLHQLRARLA